MSYSFLLLIFIILFFSVYIYIWLYHYVNTDIEYINKHIEKTILNQHNITEKSWCSIEIQSYLIFFFMCLNTIPNISKINIL